MRTPVIASNQLASSWSPYLASNNQAWYQLLINCHRPYWFINPLICHERTRFYGSFLTSIPCLVAQSVPDSRTDGRYYTVNGAKLWTVRFGNGDPLILIAGGPGGVHTGLRPFDSLATSNTLVYYDGFGRGKSDTASQVSQYSLQRDIDDLEALRKAMGFTKINLLGHSYGTVVAQG